MRLTLRRHVAATDADLEAARQAVLATARQAIGDETLKMPELAASIRVAPYSLAVIFVRHLKKVERNE